MIQKMKKNNKGFTLVELIVVIAIIGVLAAVLVPQYIQYVDKSRAATDQSALNEYFHAVEISAASFETAAVGTITMSVSSGVLTPAVGTNTSTNIDEILAEVAKIAGSTLTMKSKNGKALVAADLTITFTDGKPAWPSTTPAKIAALTTIS